MDKNVLIFVPDSLEKNKVGYLKGFYKDYQDWAAFFITDDKVCTNFAQCIGYVGKNIKNCKLKDNSLFVNYYGGKISVNNGIDKNQPVVEVVYDFKGFKRSEICGEMDTYGQHFKILIQELKKCNADVNENGRRSIKKRLILCMIIILSLVLRVVVIVEPILKYSATYLQFKDSITNLKWCLTKTVEEHRVTPKVANAVVAKFVDILIGVILLNWFLKYEDRVVNIIHTTIEDIITNLKDLLLYLMGSPIGLKLNYSFNKTLGKFFFYHITLWRVFLLGTEPLLRSYFRLLVLPGAMGFSFQVAMISDIISIATFHVYCIYVYAARLFSLQIRGLISLWRLFIGRKYNPLRERVDSCQYSQNQLFIGTLGFTILLFLLPTTTMYYAVFTTFRMVILLVAGLLQRVSLAGTIYINWKNEDLDKILIEAKLNSLPLSNIVKEIVPDTMNPLSSHSFGYVFHCMFTGILI